VELGRTYREPIVDHGMGHERALAAYARLRSVELPGVALTVF
jgi:hypothetical protein